MQKNVKEMTRDEIQEELKDLKKIQEITSQVDVNNMINKEIDLCLLKKYDMTIAPNGELFHVANQGFLPQIIEKMFADRQYYKKISIEAKKDLEKETDQDKRFEIEKKIARYNNLQLAKKVCL